MALQPRISNAAARAMLDTLTALFDAGAGPGKIRVYDGTKPAGPDTAITTQVLLAELILDDPAFAASADLNPGAIATAEPVNVDPAANNTGTATWFRALDSNNVAIDDGTVGTSDADMIVNTTSVVTGVIFTVLGWTITQPEG